MSAKALFFEPMLCESAEQPPEGPEWRYELKLDGYRAFGFSSEGRARLCSRNGKDFVRQFPEIAKAIASLPEDTAVDGEIVALDTDGKPSFALCEAWQPSGPVGMFQLRRSGIRASHQSSRPLGPEK